ncbi:MAG TPA: J domain-containing protein [Myxococcota bacterium]|jgi:hypothetical protein|nr:J domain-containing protein [Myxococcota bacterium]
MSALCVLVVDPSDERRTALAGLLAHPDVRVVEARDAAAARIAVMLDAPALCFVHEDGDDETLVAQLAADATVVLTAERFTGADGRARAEEAVAERGAHAFLAWPPDRRQVRRGAERILGVSYDWTDTFDDSSDSAPVGADASDGEITLDDPERDATPAPSGGAHERAAPPVAPASAVAEPAPAAEPTPATEPAPPAQSPHSRAALERVHETLEWATYYDVLGVERTAGPAAIKAAFHARAAHWHPDGFAAHPDAELRERAYAVYKRIAEAYRVLSNGPQRLAYDRSLPEGQTRYMPETRSSARPEDKLAPEARRFYAVGCAALEAGDYAGARRSLQLALSADPQSPVILAKLAAVDDAEKKRKGA